MMNTTTRPAPPSSTRAAGPPRAELFRLIHKAMRLAMADAQGILGETDFADAAASRAAVKALREVLAFAESHLQHEERFVKPLATERLPSGVEVFDAHQDQLHVYAELRALADAVESAPDDARPVTGHALYLHFSRFVAENLSHMADEEQVVSPLLERFFSNAELLAMHARILDAVTPAERLVSGRYMLRACSPGERRGFVSGMLKAAPKEAVLGMLGAMRGAVPDAVLDDLVAFVGAQ